MSEEHNRGALWRLEFGATVVPGGTRFRVWAPRARTLEVKFVDAHRPSVPLQRSSHDIFEVTVPGIGAGADYIYVINGSEERPDPVSRWQPYDVHGPSRVVDPSSYRWTDTGWQGLPLERYVFYELHVGTFTADGTFDAVIPRLADLRQLGVTAIELMPVVEFPGGRNWGYDGVDLYAPESAYGGPVGLMRLVDACHREGLAVVFDVVYNHIGPEGNYLSSFAPYFSGKYRTPWGDGLNFDDADSDGVRRFFIENALYWTTEFHADALRLDAIHGIFDYSALHILQELTEAVHAQARALGRPCWVIAESDLNDVRVINPVNAGGFAVDAQWSDDFHHALQVVLTGERSGYLSDFGTMADVRKALTDGFVYDGRYSEHRRRRHGNSSKDRPGHQFVVFSQNHDQVANGSGGDRLSTLVPFELQKLAAAILICAPNLPLLFMGQEYGETAPFLYFTSHTDRQLAEAVRRGRAEEFASFKWDREFSDPQDEGTFVRSRLDWSLRSRAPHAQLLALYSDLFALRRECAALHQCRKDLVSAEASESERWLRLERGSEDGSGVLCLFNLVEREIRLPLAPSAQDRKLLLWTGAIRYGGSGQAGSPPDRMPGDQSSVSLPARSGAIYTTQNA